MFISSSVILIDLLPMSISTWAYDTLLDDDKKFVRADMRMLVMALAYPAMAGKRGDQR